jgi:competence protein ComEC
MLAGYDWAAWRAGVRLASYLPLSLEGKDIRLGGRVEGLPVRTEDGWRFVLRVDAVHSPLPAGMPVADFASRIRLSWSRGFGGGKFRSRAAPAGVAADTSVTFATPNVPGVPNINGGAAPATASMALMPGQRLNVLVRLKRPHANANFLGPDFEAGMLQRGVRATGYVRAVLVPEGAALSWGPLTQWPFELRALADRTRARVARRIETVLGDASHSGVVVALAIGAQDAITPRDWLNFARTGTNHLVAISGLHVGLVAGFAAFIGGGLWRRGVKLGVPLPLWIPAQYVAGGAAVIAGAWFVALAGFGIPAQRAFCMLAAVGLAAALGRRPAPSVVICWALLCVVLIDPWAVMSAGFGLSFGAVSAIVFAMRSAFQPAQALDGSAGDQAGPVLDGREGRDQLDGLARRPAGPLLRRWRRYWPALGTALRQSAQAQWAVTIALVPLTALWFSQIPLSGPVANAVAIPWVSFLVVPAVLAGVILPAPLDAWALHCAHEAVALLARGLAWLASASWAVWRLPAPDRLSLVAAVIGVGWCLGPRGLPLQRLAPLLCLPLLLPRGPMLGEGEFRVTMLDIGQGMAVLVETRTRRLLYDAGPPVGRSDAGERIVAPFLHAQGVDALDMLVVSHDHDDHYGGAASVLRALPVRRFLASLPSRQPLWRIARENSGFGLAVDVGLDLGVDGKTIAASEVSSGSIHTDDGGSGSFTSSVSPMLNPAPVHGRCTRGQSWQWDGVHFEVLWPVDPNAGLPPNGMSCVIRVSNGLHAVLLAGDIEKAQEAALVRDGVPLQANVLLVPHHGSRTSSSEIFLDQVRPDHAVFQVGYRNRHRHPSVHVLPRYRQRGVALYRSDEDGAVRVETRRARLDVTAYRRSHRRYWMGR